ncbi:MAG TPA: hypothetical protein VKF28_08880 [Candidatus Dormibacteraeota bacterium]|nr:hypothetical protein [Candidatus Dormibacteraeota bacterium]
MGAQPPPEVGQVSPDGMWRWDGRQWSATGHVPRAQTARRSRTWVWWVAGAGALLLVIGIVGGAYGLITLARTVQQGGFSCLPSDFPHYPGAFVSGETTSLGPVGGHQCHMTYESGDAVTTVGPYFQSHLSSGDWSLISVDFPTGTITFSRLSKPEVRGTLKLSPTKQVGTHITVLLDS